MGARAPTPAQGFLCEKALTKSAFKGGRTTRGTVEVRPPSKLPLLLGGLPRKIDPLQPREGIRASGKILRSRRGEPLRRIFRAHSLPRRGTGVSPAVFRLLSSARKEGLGSKGQAWPLATGAGGRTQKENPQPGLGGHGSYWSSSFKLDGRTVSLCLAKFIE